MRELEKSDEYPYVIYEAKDFMGLYKPAHYHSVVGAREPALAAWIRDHSPFSSALFCEPDYGLIQRLDFETSGIVICAKSEQFRDQFFRDQKNGGIKKQYLTVVEGRVDKPFVVEVPIGSRSHTAKKVQVTHRKKIKFRSLPARTEIQPIMFSSKINASFVAVIIFEGRRHQIRAHLAHSGHPLVGDALYGASSELSSHEKEESPPFFLHADTIWYDFDPNREIYCLKAPVPRYFHNLIERYFSGAKWL